MFAKVPCGYTCEVANPLEVFVEEEEIK